MHTDRDTVEAGGLISYGVIVRDVIRQAGVYVGRILKGAKPAGLPVTQSSKFPTSKCSIGLLDHPVGDGEHAWRHLDAELACSS